MGPKRRWPELIQFRIDRQTKQAVERLAEKHDRTVAAELRVAIRAWVDAAQPPAEQAATS
jgi:predicted transcriptional regulator